MSPPLSTIMLAVNRADAASGAVRAAVSLARGAGARLHVGHVAPLVSSPDRDFDPFSYQELLDEAGRATLAGALRQIAHLGGCAAQGHFLTGEPVGAILGLCAKVRARIFLVLGGDPLAIGRRWSPNSALAHLVQHTTCPTLVVPPGAWPPTRVAFGEGDLEQPWRAAGLAVRIGRLCGADTEAILAHRAAPVELAASRGEARPGRATLVVWRAGRDARATPAHPPAAARSPATTLVALTRQRRAWGSLRRWSGAGWASLLGPGPTLIVPA